MAAGASNSAILWMKCRQLAGISSKTLKDEKVSHRITTWAPARAKAEAAKCVILCAACHHELHADERRTGCGTDAAYHRGCRCFACRQAHRDVGREYRERKKRAA